MRTMDIPCEMLLYPELLSNQQLINVIQERQLRVENIERMSRCELIELFRNFCVPYGQRKYRDSGRGKVLNRTRHYSPEPAVKLNIYNNQCNKISRSNCDRLKPPPDILSGHMKRIKIDSIVCDVNNSKRKMSIDSDTAASESPPVKKERKPISWP